MGFYPQLWGDKTLEQMRKELATTQRIVNTVTDYTPLTNGARAEAYNGPKIAKVSAVDMPIADDDFVNPSKTAFQILFDQEKGVPLIIKDIEKAQSNLDLVSLYTEDAKDGLLDAYDLFIIQQIITNTAVAQRLTLADTEHNKLSKADFLDARKALNAAGAPLKARYAVVNADHESDLYSIDDFISRDKIPDTVALKDGVVGRLLGFDVLLYSDMPLVNSSGLLSGTQNKKVNVFYSKLAYGFGRQKEFGTKIEPSAGSASDKLNIYSVFGGKIQTETYAVTKRDNA
ncbi:MAG TPA: hypothetical protein ENG70_02330 [Candidatus Cloacimonetes bacterium]|nr:hypothetical protein [Candidatus Cloacimonadota bacterium]HEX37683.1 hypothetical protein [Candidatus Cloacimonadota bacterium]